MKRAILLAILLALGAAMTASAQDGATCATPDNRSWVQGDGECLHIRTFTRDVTDPNPLLMVFLHGDKSSGAPLGWELNYPQQFMGPKIAAVALVRPGYPTEGGAKSSGNSAREDHYTDHNITAIAGALRRLKEYHKARELILVGYSGGAATTGVILGKFPNLADSAILLACPCNLVEWRNSGGKRAWSRSLSPSDFAATVPTNAQVLALTGNRDTNTGEKLARDYVAKLTARGVGASYRSVTDADHDTIASRPDVIAAIKEFLARVP